jgi:hypothetical protein
MQTLRDRLWRWTAPHPGWKPSSGGPGGWEREVASVAYRAADGPLVLIDPLLVDDAHWRWLDDHPSLVILQGVRYHARSAPELVERRGARMWARGTTPPAGVTAFAIDGMDGDETAFWIAEHRALVVADAVIGAGGGAVRVAPPGWVPDRASYDASFRPSLRRLLDLPIELLLVSHGEPVLHDGRAALADALEAPAWGIAAA